MKFESRITQTQAIIVPLSTAGPLNP